MRFLEFPKGTPFARRARALLAPEAPAERLAAVRIFVGAFAIVYLAARTPSFIGMARRPAAEFDPTGVITLLRAPPPGWLTIALALATLALSVPFTLGARFKITAPLFAGLLLYTLSYRNSFGMVFHTENLLVFHVAVLALADSAAAWSFDARRTGSTTSPHERYGFALQLLALISTFSYFLAGIAKVRESGLAWATSDILRNQIAYDNARKLLLGDSHSPFGAWAVRHAWFFPPFAWLTLIVEIGAPLALLGGRLGRVWALGMWSFHVGVLGLMWILFPYPIFGLAYVSLFPAERPIEWLRDWWSRRSSRGSPKPTTRDDTASAPG